MQDVEQRNILGREKCKRNRRHKHHVTKRRMVDTKSSYRNEGCMRGVRKCTHAIIGIKKCILGNKDGGTPALRSINNKANLCCDLYNTM